MSLSISIKPSAYTTLSIDVSVKNSGKEDCTFRKPTSDQRSALQYNSMIVEDATKKRVPYIGPTILNRNNNINLSPNEEFNFSTNIDRSYSLTENEEYSIRYEVACKGKSYEIYISEEAKIIASSNSEARKQVRKDPQDAVVEAQVGTLRGGHKFIGTHNNLLIDQTLEATKAALHVLQSLKNSDPLSFLKHYNEFICDKREAPSGDIFSNKVQQTYSDIARFLGNQVTYSFSGRECDPDTVAYVYAQDPGHVIYLCNQFIQAQTLPDTNNPFDSKLGTIVHEVAHKVDHCVIDNYYTFAECLDRLQNTNCSDTNNSITRLGMCPIDENDWKIEESMLGRPLNLNMYTADCIEFLAEGAYAKGDKGWSTLTYVAMGLVTIAAGMLGHRYLRREAAHPHAE